MLNADSIRRATSRNLSRLMNMLKPNHKKEVNVESGFSCYRGILLLVLVSIFVLGLVGNHSMAAAQDISTAQAEAADGATQALKLTPRASRRIRRVGNRIRPRTRTLHLTRKIHRRRRNPRQVQARRNQVLRRPETLFTTLRESFFTMNIGSGQGRSARAVTIRTR